jgi:hypothetical protein
MCPLFLGVMGITDWQPPAIDNARGIHIVADFQECFSNQKQRVCSCCRQVVSTAQQMSAHWSTPCRIISNHSKMPPLIPLIHIAAVIGERF